MEDKDKLIEERMQLLRKQGMTNELTKEQIELLKRMGVNVKDADGKQKIEDVKLTDEQLKFLNEKQEKWKELEKEREERIKVTNYLEKNAGLFCYDMIAPIEIQYDEGTRILPLYEVLSRYMFNSDEKARQGIMNYVNQNKNEYEPKTAYDVLCQLAELDNEFNANPKTNKGRNINEIRKYVAACENTKIKQGKVESKPKTK